MIILWFIKAMTPPPVCIYKKIIWFIMHSFIFAMQRKVPLLSLESLHHLHIFIFVLAVVHAVFCVTTLILGGARVINWWYDTHYWSWYLAMLTNKNTSLFMINSIKMFSLCRSASGRVGRKLLGRRCQDQE